MGSNPAIDQAITLRDPLNRFLRQGVEEGFNTAESWDLLAHALATPVPPKPPIKK